ncbi:MAG: MCE family protein [Quinella sp. 3Q1]|nr:MCE family protein [Quinella sp. 3Q1]MBR6887787.1 MCE family protein [Selenomonadaceae bacterium]
MSVEAKVGAFTVGGLMLLGGAAAGLGDFHIGGSDDYTLYAGFKQVVGLQQQSDVRLSGVLVGKVTQITTEGTGVTVTMAINEDAKIPKQSKVMITSSGVMGEKFINFQPKVDNGEYLQNGDYLYGMDEAGMAQMFDGLTKVMDKVELLLNDVHAIIGDETFKKSVVEMSRNMEEASENVNNMTGTFERIAVQNEDIFNDMIAQMNSAIAGMNNAMANVEHMTANLDKFAGDPKTVEELKFTLDNIAKTSSSVANMADNMNKFAGDPKVAEDLKATVSNARSITERADKLLGKVEGTADKISKIDVTPSVDILYSGKAHNWKTNFNLDVTSDDKSLILGAEDIGNHTKLNLQGGKKFGTDFGARAGVIAGKPGIGLDAYAGDNFKFSAEAYDLNHGKVRLKSQFRVAESTYILGELHNVNKKKDRAFYFGLKQEF